jgi:hypothetical protein
MISSLSKKPVPLTTMVCFAFHQPKLMMSDPLTLEAILDLSNDSIPVQSDIIHGLYLRYEQDTQDNRISHFNSGKVVCLQKDLGQELRAVLKTWVKLWKNEARKWSSMNSTSDDEHDIDIVHLCWVSRIAIGLRDELFLLGTAQRWQGYVSSIVDRRIEIPNMSSV